MKVYKLDKHHLDERTKWLNNPGVYLHMNMQYPITLLETEKWFERIVTDKTRMDLVFEENNQIVAMSGLTGLDTINGLIELYIMVNPNKQSKGFGLKTCEFTVNYAFSHYNIQKVYLYTNSFNTRANELYFKLGFIIEGTLRKHKFRNGEYIDRFVYGLLKEDWSRMEYSKKSVDLEF